MRYLLIKAQKELFAHELCAYLLFGLVAYHVVGEELRSLGRIVLKLIQKLVQSLAVFCRHGNNSVKFMRGGIKRHDLKKLCFFHGVYLIYDENRRNTSLLYAGNELLLLPADIRHRLNEQHDGIYIGNAFLDNIDHIVAQAGARLMKSRSVDYNKLRIAAVDYRAYAVSRCLRLIGNYGDLLADKRICER